MSDQVDVPNDAELGSAETPAPPPPRSRRWRRPALAAAALLAITVGLGVGAFAAMTVYAQYGAVRNGPNALAWGGLEPRFAGAAACTSCHRDQATVQDASAHVNVSCEDCHGPGAAHGVSDTTARTVAMRGPGADVCVTCHATTPGRPASFPQIDPARHYSGGVCLRCHDPHSISAVRPPVVTHPLNDLPICTTCHAPDGLKQIPKGHELVPDATCLACHSTIASGRPR